MKRSNILKNFINPGTAVITGASSGLGESFAKELAKYGFNLVLVARRKERLQEIAQEIKLQNPVLCTIMPADLSLVEDIEKVATFIKGIDDLDILVNNAGFATLGCFMDVPVSKSIQMLNVHMTSSVQFSYSALNVFKNRKRGAIINVSSLGAFILTPGNVLYSSTKSFLVTFSENLRIELEDKGILIQSLCPGFIQTEFHSVGDLQNFDKSKIPDIMWMKPEEVVLQSLEALGRETLFIPGWKNKLSKWLFMHCPFIRRTLQRKVRERDFQ